MSFDVGIMESKCACIRVCWKGFRTWSSNSQDMFRIWLPCSAVLRWGGALVDQKDPKDPNGFWLLHRRQASTHVQKLSDIHSIPYSIALYLLIWSLGELHLFANFCKDWRRVFLSGDLRWKKRHIPNLQTGKNGRHWMPQGPNTSGSALFSFSVEKVGTFSWQKFVRNKPSLKKWIGRPTYHKDS